MKKLMLVLVAATAGTLFAADDDLICFYPFTDGEPGTRPPATLTTYIGVEGLPAATYGKKGQDKGSFFDSDVPSKYVFPSKSATVPLTSNYQSIVSDDSGGCQIDFPDLATRLSKNGQPYTIEMFFKPGKQITYKKMISYMHGANEAQLCIPFSYSADNVTEKGANAAICCPYATRGTCDHRDGTYGPYFYRYGLNFRSFEDGHWHHVAIVYDGVNKLSFYYDYLLAASVTAVGGELDKDSPLHLCANGSSVSYGKFAAFRATAAALSPKDFIYASNEPNRALPETRMYLRFETEGASAGDPAIGYFKNDAATVTAMDYDYAIAAFRTNLVDGVWVTNRLQYCDQVQKGTVFSGTQRVGKNRMSIRNRPQIDREAYDGTCGFPRLMKSYFNQLDGDFTVECFLKLDYMSTSRDTTIFGQQNYEYYKKTGDHYTTWGLTMSTSGVLSYYVQDARYTVKSKFTPLNDYKWHHFALTYTKDKRKLTLYVDGEEMPSKTLDFDLDVSSQPINFGSEMNYQVFNGCFDEIRITRRLLAPSEFLYQKDLGMMILLK